MSECYYKVGTHWDSTKIVAIDTPAMAVTTCNTGTVSLSAPLSNNTFTCTASIPVCNPSEYLDSFSNSVSIEFSAINFVDRIIESRSKKTGQLTTCVLWADKTKTLVKCMEGEKEDREAAFCAALAKKIYGSKLKKIVKEKFVD